MKELRNKEFRKAHSQQLFQPLWQLFGLKAIKLSQDLKNSGQNSELKIENFELSNKVESRKLKVESGKVKVERNKKQKTMILIAERLSDIIAVQPCSPWRILGCSALFAVANARLLGLRAF